MYDTVQYNQVQPADAVALGCAGPSLRRPLSAHLHLVDDGG